jgi:hypothetical protein
VQRISLRRFVASDGSQRGRVVPLIVRWLCRGILAGVALSAFTPIPHAQQQSSHTFGVVPRQHQRVARLRARRSFHRPATPAAAQKSVPIAAPTLATQTTPHPKPQDTPLTAPWQSIGPAQVSTSTYGLVTGRVTSIAADPSDSSGNTVYVGTTGGGVWKSTNATAAPANVTFAPLTDDLSAFSSTPYISLSIGALTVQPGGTGVILAGTGDPNDAADSYYGVGILRSTDNGQTWSVVSHSADDMFGTANYYSFLGNAFSGFAWSTADTSLVVAAVTDAPLAADVNLPSTSSVLGLYYSHDSGQTWQLATIEDSSSAVIQSDQMSLFGIGNAATSVAWNPVRQRFYAAVRFHGYYESTDGITWTRLANQPGVNLNDPAKCPPNAAGTGSSACPIFRGAVAAQPVTGDLFALTADINNLDQGLWQDQCGLVSGNCASSTVQFATQIADVPLDASSTDTTIPQADYDLYLAAVPSQQGTLLFAGTEDIYRCSLANSCAWRNTTNSLGCAAAQVAPAQHAIDTTLPDVSVGTSSLLYFGNDGGLWRSTDDVNQQNASCSFDDPSHFQNLNGGIGSLAEVESLSNDPVNAQISIAALGALGTAATTTATTVWNQVLDGEGDQVAIDQSNPANWYADSLFGVGINLCTNGSSCDITGFGTQPVIGPAQVSPTGNANQSDATQQTIPAPWILDPQNTANILVGTCRVWRGAASGIGWSATSLLSTMLDGDNGPVCNGNSEIRSLAASGHPTDAPGAPETIYAGMAGLFDGGAIAAGHLYTASVTSSSTSASTAWTDLYNSAVTNDPNNGGQFNPGSFDISDIYVDPHDSTGQTIYVSIQGFSTLSLSQPLLYMSTSGGASWTSIQSNLPPAPVDSVLVDPNDAGTVYVATDIGVYVTTSVSSCPQTSASCWSLYGTSLPSAPVTQLTAFNAGSTSVLRAATYGRGIWQIGLITAGTGNTTATASPTSLTFSGQAIETVSAAQSVTVTNTGALTLNVSSVAVSGDYTEQDNCSGMALAPLATCAVQVAFAPTATGQRTGTLSILGNLPAGQLTVSLTGTGTTAGAILLAPTVMSFPTTLVGATATAQVVTVSNTGGQPVTLTSEAATGDFAISVNTCGTSLSINTGCSLSITFTPTSAGARSGALTLIDGAGTQTIQLSGTGATAPTDTLTPLSLAFGSVLIGSSSSAQQVTLSNTGTEALNPVSVQAGGDFTAANACGSSLEGNATCAISVTFVPKSSGAETGTLTITDPIHTQTVALSGTGVAPPTDTLSPSALIFGVQTVGTTSAPELITLSNTGDLALTGISLAIHGDFAQTSTCSAALAAHSSCSISVTFSPQASGSEAGTLTVTDALHTLTVPLSGGSSGPPALSAAPTSLSFGNLPLGQTSSAQTVTLTNTGGVPLTGLAWTASPGFSIASTTCGTTLSLSATCQFSLTFTPSTAGSGTGALSITASNLAAPTVVSLSGFAEDFTLQASGSPATVTSGQTATFTLQVAGVNGTAGTVSLACTGAPQNSTCSLNPTSVSFTGSSTGSVTVTVVTGTGTTTAALHPAVTRWKDFGFALAFLLPVGCLGFRRRRSSWLLAVILLLGFPIACGVSVSGGGGGGKQPPGGTPSGTYSLTVTGSMSGLQHSVAVSLTVE